MSLDNCSIVVIYYNTTMSDKMKLDKRQRIIAAALSLFRGTHDIRRVSLETIAREARVSPTTIYNNFGNRENLISEVIKFLLRENLAHNIRMIRSDIPFAQKLTSIISSKMDVASELNGEIITKIISQDNGLAPFFDEVYEKEIRPLWLEMLAEGKRQGYIDGSLDDEVLLAYLDILKAGISARQDVLHKLTEDVKLVEQLTHITYFGFLKKDIDLFKK